MRKYIIITILAAFFTGSCSEDILYVENKGALAVSNWYRTAEDFQMAMNSCYIGLAQDGMHALHYTHTFGTWEDRVLFETTGRDRISVSSSDNDVREVWEANYMGVYRTSRLLQKLYDKGLDGIENMTREHYDYLEGQAKALRAIHYFYLTIIFDRPILYDENTIPEDLMQDLSNADRELLWAQIEQDLSDAIPKLPLKSETAPEDIGRVTKGAAKALYGKAMLFKHYYYHARFGSVGSAEDIADLTKAKDYFLEVMNSGVYQLVMPGEPKTRKDYLYAILSNSSFKDLPSENNLYPSENNIESIWEVQYADHKAFQDNWWLPAYYSPGALFAQYYSPHTRSYKNHEANPALYYEFEAAGAPAGFDRDPRCYASFYFDGDTMDFDPESPYYTGFLSGSNDKLIARARGLQVPPGTQSLGIRKHYFPVYWDGLYAPFNDPINRRLIRYADLLLMYAETMFLLGDDGSGLDALNQVRRRVDMPDVGTLTTDAIIHERDVELAFEGHRWFDLIRWSFDDQWNIVWEDIDWGINASNSIIPFVEGKNEFMPIPLEEIDINGGKLEQNPGW